MVIYVENGCKCISCLPSWPHGWKRCSSLPRPASPKSVIPRITSPNSKFKVWFLPNVYCFHTLESQKNHKSNIFISKAPSVLISTYNLIFYEYRHHNTSLLLLHSQFFFPRLLTFYLPSDHLQSKYGQLSLVNKPPLYRNFGVSHEELAFWQIILLLLLQRTW